MRTVGQRPVEHAALERDARVLARLRRAGSVSIDGVAEPSTTSAPSRLRRARWRRRGRGSAAPPPACRSASCSSSTMIEAEARRAARTRPSACRRRRRRRRGGCAATDRGARRPRARCAGWPRARRTRRGTAPPPPASARSPGTSSSTCRPARADARGQAQVDLGLAAAGHAVQQRHAEAAGVGQRAPAASNAAACSAVSWRVGVGGDGRQRRALERIALVGASARGARARARPAARARRP